MIASPLTPQNIKNVESKDYFETQYQILKKLGSGSFSDVFKVMHRKDSKLYAVKRLKNQYTGVKDRYLFFSLLLFFFKKN